MKNQTARDTQSLIEVKNLSFKRGERVIYDDVSLNIRRGQITAIMGPSGTGKTTLLRLIGGQLVPEHGQVLLDGKDIATISLIRCSGNLVCARIGNATFSYTLISVNKAPL